MTMNDWRAELRLELEKLVDAAVVAGARQRDVYAAILDEIGQLRLAYERDPDPADDISEQVIEEPSNNWPAAENRMRRTTARRATRPQSGCEKLSRSCLVALCITRLYVDEAGVFGHSYIVDACGQPRLPRPLDE